MKNDLNSYIKVYNLLPKQLCDKTISEIENANWEPHVFYFPELGEYKAKSGDKELSVFGGDIPSKPELMGIYWQAIFNYVKDLDFPWFANWQGYTSIRFNKYENSKLMAKHCDHITEIFDGQKKGIPTLSVVSALNDNYSGGEFIMFDDYEIKLNQGDILIFPSTFMYPHTVKEVTEGIRYSAVSWVW
jgi:2OG-Fe(II) oxygenase superfamily